MQILNFDEFYLMLVDKMPYNVLRLCVVGNTQLFLTKYVSYAFDNTLLAVRCLSFSDNIV